MPESRLISKRKIENLLVSNTATVLEAMEVIDRGAAQIALVVCEEEKIVGVITDGDLRRAILKGATLTSSIEPFVNANFRSVTESTGRTEALDLMQCFAIEQLPVLDSDQKVVGLHLFTELVRAEVLPNAAMILAGGKGTRLGKLTRSTPKPMIKVAGRPILERIVLHLVGSGIQRIFLSTNYLAETIKEHFGNGEKFGCSIEYLDEQEPLGTGGPLALLKEHKVNEPVLVMNGDLVAEFNVGEMFSVHNRANNKVTIGVKTYTHEVPFGCMEVEGDRVCSLVEKPVLQRTVNTGIYVISPDVFAELEPVFTPITSLIEGSLDAGESVGAFFVDDWIDVGQPEQLSQARGESSNG